MSDEDPQLTLHPDARNWLSESVRNAWQELLRYVRTAARMIARPRQFGAAWTQGELVASNPLAFFATSVGITSTVGLLVDRGASGGGWAGSELAQQVDPYVQYVLLGLLCHLFLRPLGARRPWFVTLGISLFAGGGPAALADMVTSVLALVASGVAGSSESAASTAVNGVVTAGIVVANLTFFISFALGLAGVHRIKLWRIVVSLMAAQVVLALLRVLVFRSLLEGGRG